MTGYSSSDYAASFADFGTPRLLPHSSGWILQREITPTNFWDAMGCYPLFSCEKWQELHRDLEELKDLVSLTLVTDPFGSYDLALLNNCFPELVVPFKDHLVTDLSQVPDSFVAAHHRRNARKALSQITVERCAEPIDFAGEWISLYANLVNRHGITGLTAFSEATFRTQLCVPGITMFRAMRDNETLGITLWYSDRGAGYYHLGAYSDAGYALGASFAIFWTAIEHFKSEGLKWLNLGAGAGLSSSEKDDGLGRFKRGWSTGTRTAYLCGRIFNRAQYVESMTARGISESSYFPAYRKGEFV